MANNRERTTSRRRFTKGSKLFHCRVREKRIRGGGHVGDLGERGWVVRIRE